MRGKGISRLVLGFCGAALLTATGCAMKKSPEMAKASPPPPTKEEMMAKWQEYATPGAGHQIFQPMVGKWDYTITMWTDPGSTPEVSKGQSDIKLIMGGRFVEQTVKGKSMGMPFEGMGLLGYDNATNQYRTVWVDSMGTGMMTGTGQYNSATKSLENSGVVSCPMYGTMEFRDVTTFIDSKHMRYEAFMTQPGTQQENKAVSIEYTKKNG